MKHSKFRRRFFFAVIIPLIFFFTLFQFQNCSRLQTSSLIEPSVSNNYPDNRTSESLDCSTLNLVSETNTDSTKIPSGLGPLIPLLETLSDDWVQEAVNSANNYLSDTSYSAKDWELFFDYYFSTHPLTNSLSGYLGYPVFYWFSEEAHLNLQTALSRSFVKWLSREFQKHRPGTDLSAALVADHELQNSFSKFFALASLISAKHIIKDSEYIFMYNFFSKSSECFPESLSYSSAINIEAQPFMAALRAGIQSLMLMKPGFDADAFIQNMRMTGSRAEILKNYGVLVQDNFYFNQSQLNAISSLLGSVPKGIYYLKQIGQNDSLGNRYDYYFKGEYKNSPAWMSFPEAGGVNIFRDNLSVLENQFPADVPTGFFPIFCTAMQHELNHMVDATYINKNENLKARKLDLISRAGTDRMQYLRTPSPSDFFVNSPQEFVASISNQFLSSTLLTLRLGLIRFDAGYKEPINQFLFILDVYSKESNSSVFFNLDQNGKYNPAPVNLSRDNSGHINSLQFENKTYSFNLDASGNVTGYQVSP